jgi:hypothetical protein
MTKYTAATNGPAVTPTKEQRARMAAHLCDIAAQRLRSGGFGAGEQAATGATEVLLGTAMTEALYVANLRLLLVPLADIDAACAAIFRGEHPPDSLPGRLEEMRGDAKDTVESSPEGSYVEREAVGAELAYCNVLDLLGCKLA